MPPLSSSYRIVTLVLLVACAGTAEAQTERSARMIDEWLAGQRSALVELESISVRTTVRHAVDTSVSTRVATYAADMTLDLPDDFPDNPPGDLPPGPPRSGNFPPLRHRGAGPGPPPGPDIDMRLLWMTLDGDTLETAYARRVLQRLRGMLRPEMTRLLDDMGIPAAHIARLEPVGEPVNDRIGAQPALRIDMIPGGGAPRRPRISLWFDDSGRHLIATRFDLPFPGGRQLTAFTEYGETGGLDLPVSRTVSGVVPVPRRGRDVTLALDHRTRFADYEFRFKD